MGLEDTIKDLKEKIAAEEKVEEIIEDPVEEPKEEEAPKEEPKEEPKPEVKEEEPDANAYQRMRREKAAAEKRAEEAERKLEEQSKKETPSEEVEEQAAPEVNPEIVELVQDRRMEKAEKEFLSLESKYRAKHPEYDGVASEYGAAIAQSIKIQNPRMSNDEVARETKKTLLMKAAKFLDGGFDPIEELFHEGKELGFTGKKAVKEEPKEEVEEEIKPDMKKVAENRKKSTGMASSTGKSEGQMTKQFAASISNEEWMRLPKSEKARLLSQ